jgi:tetratricopeptide (TPR) repeat protein
VEANKLICPWCGIANPEGATLCIGCGSELGTGAVPGSEPPVSTPAPAVAAPAAPAAAMKAQSPSPKSKGKEPKKATITVEIKPGYVYAVIAAVVILGYFYFKKDAPAPEVPQNTVLVQTDSTGQRISSMEKFLAANPQDTQARLAYANMLQDSKQFTRAIAAYKQYLESDAKNPDARVDMAVCLFESGDGAEAIVQLTKALQYNPKHQPAMFNMGIVYLNQEKVKESNDWFSRCVAVDPNTEIASHAKQLLSQHSLTNKNLQ